MIAEELYYLPLWGLVSSWHRVGAHTSVAENRCSRSLSSPVPLYNVAHSSSVLQKCDSNPAPDCGGTLGLNLLLILVLNLSL